MMTKTTIFLFCLAILMISSISFALSLPAVLVEGVDPQPVEPGKDFTVDVTFYNRESNPTGDFFVSLETPRPIIFKSSENDVSVLNLCGSCKKQNKYFFTVDPSAISGTYTIYIVTSSGNVSSKQPVDIKVQGRPNIIFLSDTHGLNNVTPGSAFSVVLHVTNLGSGQAHQIKIQPDSPNFNVLGGSIKTIDALNSNETKNVTIDFIAVTDMKAASYSIPFKISYLDEKGSTANISQSLGVNVINKGEISVQTIKAVSSTGSTTLVAGQPFSVVVRLENTGPGDADDVIAEMNCPFDSNKRSFLGQLKDEEDAPAVFDMSSSKSGNFECLLNVTYLDDTGIRTLSDKFNLGIASPDYSGSIILVIILILIAVFIFRKRLFRKKIAHHK